MISFILFIVKDYYWKIQNIYSKFIGLYWININKITNKTNNIMKLFKLLDDKEL